MYPQKEACKAIRPKKVQYVRTPNKDKGASHNNAHNDFAIFYTKHGHFALEVAK